jgi:hypothetical protein
LDIEEYAPAPGAGGKTMDPENPVKKLIPSGCSTDEFTHFDKLSKLVVPTPKKDIPRSEKKVKKASRRSK